MTQSLRPAVVVFVVLTLVTGVAYPLAVTAIAQTLFPHEANGSPIHAEDGTVVGSSLIGQGFSRPEYFWSRPSATAKPYDAAASSGSNLGPSNPALVEAVSQRVTAVQANGIVVPVDLVTASASGLDPHISPASAYYQVPRVAAARGLPEEEVRRLVDRYVEGRTLGILGEPRVNVLLVNRALGRN